MSAVIFVLEVISTQKEVHSQNVWPFLAHAELIRLFWLKCYCLLITFTNHCCSSDICVVIVYFAIWQRLPRNSSFGRCQCVRWRIWCPGLSRRFVFKCSYKYLLMFMYIIYISRTICEFEMSYKQWSRRYQASKHFDQKLWIKDDTSIQNRNCFKSFLVQ